MPEVTVPGWAALVRAPNPGPMTLDGTNTWILRAPGAAGCIVVDPGPADAGHVATLAGHAPVELIVLTHRHLDHTEAVAELSGKLGGVPVAAAAAELCRDAPPLRDGDRIGAAGLQVTVLATPGHTADSICLVVQGEQTRAAHAVLTGDTILGRGTAVISWPDGDLGAYLRSLEALTAYSGVPALPGHGPMHPDCAAIAAAYRAHRDQRLDEVRAALHAGARTPEQVVAAVYPGLEPALVAAAASTVRAALAYLSPDAPWRDAS